MFPNLIKLEYISVCDIPYNRVEEERLSIYTADANFTTTALKSLHLRVPILTSNFMEYPKWCYPAGSMHNIRVVIDNINLYQWMETVGVDAAMYITDSKHLNFRYGHDYDDFQGQFSKEDMNANQHDREDGNVRF